jgi:hypothetical protein
MGFSNRQVSPPHNGRDLLGLRGEALRDERRQMQMVFQDSLRLA